MDVRAGQEKGWALKNWCLRTVVLENTLESPLDCEEIKPVNPKGNQPWTLIGRMMLKLKLKLQYCGHLMSEPTHWKRPWCREWLKAEGEGGDRGLDAWMALLTQWAWVWVSSERWWRTACCSPRGRKESDMTEQMNNSWFKLFYNIQVYLFCFWSNLFVYL